MKVKRAPSNDKVDLNMTPMIDIVFQLLTFFLFSIKPIDTEGSFNIKMPTPAKQANPEEDPAFPKVLRMKADQNGWLASVKFDKGDEIKVSPPVFTDGMKHSDKVKEINNESVRNAFGSIHQKVKGMFGTGGPPGGAAATEVELDCDSHLKYNYVIQAITAVSGERQSNGNITPLIEKIKFKPKLSPAAK